MMLGVDRDRHVVADNTGTAPARRHRSGIGIGERYLLIGRGQHPRLESLKALHLVLKLGELLLEPRGLRDERLRGRLPVGGVELAQITRDALLELCPAPLYLRAREVLIPVVHRLELAAVDGNARCRKQTHLAAELDEARANLADRRAIVLPEISDRLMVGDEAAKQPHHLEVTASLALKPPARLHPIEVAVNVKLQENRGMIGRPPGCLRFHSCEPKLEKIERLDERVDRSNRVILIHPVIEAFGQKRRLPAIRALDKALHPIPRKSPLQGKRITAGQSSETLRFHA